MSETPVELIVSAFQSEDGADNAMRDLVAAKRDRLLVIREAAVVRRDANNKLHINERGDLSTGQGAGSGAALGAAIGIFGGPIGALIGGGLGAAIGGLAGRLIDSGIPNHRLEQIGAALKPGTSALVAMVEHTWADELEAEIRRAGGDTLAQAVTADIARQLEAGKEVAYSAVAAAGGTIATRATQGPDGTSFQGIATDGENFVAGALKATGDTVKGIVTDGQEFVAGIVQKVEETAAAATETVTSATADAGDAVAEATDDAAAAAKDAGETVADAAADATKAAKDAVKDAKDAVS